MKRFDPIEMAVRLRRLKLADIARECGHSYATVLNVIRRKSKNQVIQEYIAKLLDVRPEELWGFDYAPAYRAKRFLYREGYYNSNITCNEPNNDPSVTQSASAD